MAYFLFEAASKKIIIKVSVATLLISSCLLIIDKQFLNELHAAAISTNETLSLSSSTMISGFSSEISFSGRDDLMETSFFNTASSCCNLFDSGEVLDNQSADWTEVGTEVIVGNAYPYDSIPFSGYPGIGISGGIRVLSSITPAKWYYDSLNTSNNPQGDYFLGPGISNYFCVVDQTIDPCQEDFTVCIHASSTSSFSFTVETYRGTSSNVSVLASTNITPTSTSHFDWQEYCLNISAANVPGNARDLIVSINGTVYLDNLRVVPLAGATCLVCPPSADCDSFPAPYTCNSATMLLSGLLPSGDGQTTSFPFGTGAPNPASCGQYSNYGGQGLVACNDQDLLYIARFEPTIGIDIWNMQTNSLEDSILLSLGEIYDVVLSSDCSYLYVATIQGVERIDLATNTVDQTRLRADFDAVATGDGETWGLDIHPTTGEVYVTFGLGSDLAIYGGGDQETSILKVGNDLQGTITEVVPNELYGTFMGIKFLPNGNFWVTWDGDEPPGFNFPFIHSEEIRLYDETGSLILNKPIIIGGNQEFFTQPNDIAFGPDGNIYVSTYAMYSVVRYLPATDIWEEYLGVGPSGSTSSNIAFLCASVFCDEICGNGIDDDFDGLIDCSDPDCDCCEAQAPALMKN